MAWDGTGPVAAWPLRTAGIVQAEYVRLHDLFGRPGGDPTMKTLKKIRAAAKEAAGSPA